MVISQSLVSDIAVTGLLAHLAAATAQQKLWLFPFVTAIHFSAEQSEREIPQTGGRPHADVLLPSSDAFTHVVAV